MDLADCLAGLGHLGTNPEAVADCLAGAGHLDTDQQDVADCLGQVILGKILQLWLIVCLG